MTPIGTPLNEDLFLSLGKRGSHNVDKAMLAGDMSLVTIETALQTRIAAAKALALLRRYSMQVGDFQIQR
jgi:TATA-binding protein-associated factor